MAADDVSGRSRTITWQDPMPVGDAARDMSGLDFLRQIASGQLPPPPISESLDFYLDRVEEGFAVFICTPAEHHYNPISVVHGGLAATLIDSATGCAVHSTLPKGHGYTTINISVDLLRAITTATGRMRCEGRVVHRGSRLAIAEGTLIAEEADKVLARGQTTCMIFPP
ncbi:MAG: PaaI family thioesterase [Alphaproteobacteria bacterium]|nr:PaaI family thioesterase [Alphaproteobacteria bacterium]